MCETFDTAEPLAVIRRARELTDAVLPQSLIEPLGKAMYLSTGVGFDRAVGSLSRSLRRSTQADETAALRTVVAELDVDWHRTTPAQRRKLISQAMNAAGRHTALIPARIESPFGDAADEVVASTRSHARQAQGLAIGADLNAMDRRVTEHLVSSNLSFVTNEYGRRLDGLGEQARRIVADGVEAGLGRDQIAGNLKRAAERSLIGRSASYWDVVAASFIANGRSFAQLSSYAEAGIERYLIEAVLDEQTTEACRFLHGKTFSVGDGIRRFEQIESLDDPDEIKASQPWVRQATDRSTGRTALYVNRDGVRTPLAEVTRSGVGSKDDLGEFARAASSRELMDMGVGFPPYHGLCRTTTVPVI